MTWFERLRRTPDVIAIVVLIALWGLFYWRIYTPSTPDALSLVEGDFSGQFVAWTSYSAERIQAGEIPLWNPYMNAGAPFLADPQTAVFYPPRLLTIAVLGFDKDIHAGDVYAALQIEMTVHVLLGTLLMYLFLRRITAEYSSTVTILSSVMGALVFGFGGFMNAYAPLQLPLLETFIWFPLVMLGIHEATNGEKIGWRCLVLGGTGLGLAVLAGHPQTVLFIGYTAVAYLIYRSWERQYPLSHILLGIGGVGVVGAMFSGVAWLPALQFQMQTYRAEFGFDDKGGGFAFQDILQLLFPKLLGKWSPLYISVLGLIAVGVAIWQRVKGYAFWAGVALFGGLVAFGEKLVFYDLVYLLLPGFALFRGQERAAVLVTMAGAVLATLGLAHLINGEMSVQPWLRLRKTVLRLMILAAIFSFVFFILRLMPPYGELYETALGSSIFALVMIILLYALLSGEYREKVWWKYALVALVVVELFSVNMGGENYESIPAQERLPEPAYIPTIRATLDEGQRVEGLRGITRSYGSLYRLADIWGDSPLRLEATEFYLWDIPIEQRWELLGVQVVNSEWEALPVSSIIVGTGEDEFGKFNIFRLENPRPFAHMVFQAQVETDDVKARQQTADLNFPLRDVIILSEAVGELPQEGSATATVEAFEPEYIHIQTSGETSGVLSLALPYDGNWQVEIDGQDAKLIKAYGGLSAVYMPSGNHTVELYYRPWTFSVGLALSGVMVLMLIGSIGYGFWERWRTSVIEDMPSMDEDNHATSE